ncbi:aromatic ring-hydroxylating dioxygenase subunit alpha [Actibacterium sp. 188UL27-1]|uniref:aromatic ring-hydroxylating oxygenase subunit alpha n=1 Tax=Actibacterium sp. 188UL27-1 TaxID=2786961 RepID=UPI001958A3E8|nr:SRPBCC family protein [Actibacterium sp. 188UL27-1]MBM7067728.1 Rieske 2Fe-2S domain-containing protein [Actibacterium sp. 188UL27-1]
MPKGLTDLSRVSRPLEHANGLPNAHYTDASVYAEECAALMFSTWAGLDVAADVPEPGDAKPIDFLGQPLLLVRDRARQVRVFQNICRHRGMVLVSEPRRIEGALRCPYHSWCYKLSGELVSTPHVGGPGHNTHAAMDRDTLGLIEVRSHIWRDVVWINLSGDAPPFEEVHGDLMARWAEMEHPLFHGGSDSRFTLAVRGNWKLAVENYCESYHLPWIHPGLNSYSRLQDHYHIEAPGAYSGQGTLLYRQLTGADGQPFPDFADLSDRWDTGGEYIAVYPNVLLAAHRDHAYAMILLPRGPDRTLEHTHLYYAQPDTDAELRERNRTLWQGVLEEDIFVIEGMQRGRHATGFDGGRFSPAMDGPTHCFHDWVAKRLSAYRDQAQ